MENRRVGPEKLNTGLCDPTIPLLGIYYPEGLKAETQTDTGFPSLPEAVNKKTDIASEQSEDTLEGDAF